MFMDNNDIFYRAYQEYKEEFKDNRDDHLFKKAVNARSYPDDFLTMEEAEVVIHEDWIKEIEKGIVYINKAIKEDRQFIRNEGEVLPIERIRRVNKDSISDLAKHSDYITRMPEEPGDTVIPEKLLMVTRENDYLIYENRVVYATLSYLKDFIAVRLNKIRDSISKYEGKCQIKKKVDLGYRIVDFSMELTDIRKNDPIAEKKNKYGQFISRIDAILNAVMVLIKTPLMNAVSKAPLVTRPITKTNVLKMNTNFKESLALFDYVCGYQGDGFEIIPKTTTIAPLSIEQQNGFTDIISLACALTYEYNNGLSKKLNNAYIAENRARQQKLDKDRLDRIEELRNKSRKSEQDIKEYLYDLEQGYDVLKRNADEAHEDVVRLTDEYDEKIQELNDEHNNEVEGLKEAHEAEKEAINTVHNEEMDRMNEVFVKEKSEIAQRYDAEIASINQRSEEKEATITSLKEEVQASKNHELDVIKEADNKVKEAKDTLALAHAENLALRVALNKPKVDPADFTSKERFNELEYEKTVLDSFFDKAWELTKKEIRKIHAKDYKKK